MPRYSKESYGLEHYRREIGGAEGELAFALVKK